jgi:ABC-2 type transport system ATP-binding protein
MNTILRIEGACKRFAAVHALAGADVELRQGELLALLGPNGAGKTTLVRAIAGRVRLDAGTLTLFGQAVGGANSKARQRLGVVPQEIALYSLLTATENLHAFARFHGLAGERLSEQVARALAWTGLADRARDAVKGFSGGMKRRLNIACGVLHEPDIVLLDEPTVGVDPQSRERIWEMLDKLRADGRSLILTTHQLDEAQTRCDRVTIIDHGKTIANGTFAELVAQTIGPKREITLTLDQPLTQGLAGIDARVDGRALRLHVSDVAGELPSLLERIRQAGRQVEDVEIKSPSLQSVFLHLTGRELRE